MRRLGAKNFIPLDLEIDETLRKIRKDKRAATQTEQQPMDNMNEFIEEEVGSEWEMVRTLIMPLRPIKDYARPSSTTQRVIRRPTIQESTMEFNSLDSHTRIRMPTS